MTLQIEVYVRQLVKLILKKSFIKVIVDQSNLCGSIKTQLKAIQTKRLTSNKYATILSNWLSCVCHLLERGKETTSDELVK